MRVVDPTFGVRLRELRNSRGLSLRQLATLAYVSKSQISEWETGRRRPSLDLAQTLDEALGANGELASLVIERPTDVLVSAAIAAPRQIDAEQVEALPGTLAFSRRLDDSLPASALLPAVEGQWATVQILARDVRGPAARDLHLVAAQYGQFAGWMNSQVRNDKRAESLLSTAARDALTLGDPDLASQTHGFRGALERRKANPRGIARWFMAAYETPGISNLHKVDAALKAAHGLGLLGDQRGAGDLLNKADDLTTALPDDASSPVAYWLTPSWLRLSGGLAHLGVGNHQRAADSLRAGLHAMPDGWEEAEWAGEYLDALSLAEAAGP
ncbi:helix-turn-helix transcriptional regulator [Nocardioides sp. KC13]|uniref:Helix-turn-helix transcriptional regulator n=1 Tax=Nocardioides turkmenicus TaxID=2711220 RepID=A0A6M1QZ23_9ACTN|nr:helix-turn-helix transcriptional regulator [Nocardioides sp. KC13]NGN92642.1 helix-turn-helix transcriptional regulator [Nocardioides sp. KC13]